MRFTFQRDPALWTSLAATTIRLVSAFFVTLSVEQQAGLNAVVAAVAGLAIAYQVGDGQNAAILGFIQAALALAVGFGLQLAPDNQAILMSFAGTLIAMFVRTQVRAPIPPRP